MTLYKKGTFPLLILTVGLSNKFIYLCPFEFASLLAHACQRTPNKFGNGLLVQSHVDSSVSVGIQTKTKSRFPFT